MGVASRRFARDVARQLSFEAAVRRRGVRLEHQLTDEGLLYHLYIGVPGHNEERAVAVLVDERLPDQVRVRLDGPVCLRHRYLNDSLCMWWRHDGAAARWQLEDGLEELIAHIRLHAWCEADCRAGRPWPKAEAPGSHARPADCPTCRGVGA